MREASQVGSFSAQDVRLVSVKLCCEDKPKLSLEDSWGCCTMLSAARRSGRRSHAGPDVRPESIPDSAVVRCRSNDHQAETRGT